MVRSRVLEATVSKRYWAPEDGRRLVDAFRASGESAAAFCRALGLSRQRLRYWLARHPVSTPTPVGFAELVLAASPPSPKDVAHEVRLRWAGVEVCVPSGVGAEFVAAVARGLSC